jgi:hypothetical protein
VGNGDRDGNVERGGFRQQMLLREGKGTWYLGEVEKWGLPRPQPESRE